MKNNSMFDSFKNAFNGIVFVIKNEANFFIHIIISILIIILCICVKFSSLEFIQILFCISLVLSLELINTSIENIIDLICGENYNQLGKIVKDTSAGAVLVSVIFSGIIGLVIFYNKIISLKENLYYNLLLSFINKNNNKLLFLILGIIFYILSFASKTKDNNFFVLIYKNVLNNLVSIIGFGICFFILIFSNNFKYILYFISIIINSTILFKKTGFNLKNVLNNFGNLFLSIFLCIGFLNTI